MLTSAWTILKENIFTDFQNFRLSLSYLRFIDHIFFIQTGNKSHPANNILNGLNTNRKSIKFAYKDFNQVLLFPHRSLWQKQQTIHKDFRKRSR